MCEGAADLGQKDLLKIYVTLQSLMKSNIECYMLQMTSTRSRTTLVSSASYGRSVPDEEAAPWRAGWRDPPDPSVLRGAQHRLLSAPDSRAQGAAEQGGDARGALPPHASPRVRGFRPGLTIAEAVCWSYSLTVMGLKSARASLPDAGARLAMPSGPKLERRTLGVS